jgi:hypothetical protein
MNGLASVCRSAILGLMRGKGQTSQIWNVAMLADEEVNQGMNARQAEGRRAGFLNCELIL